jgi:hypothetical protein
MLNFLFLKNTHSKIDITNSKKANYMLDTLKKKSVKIINLPTKSLLSAKKKSNKREEIKNKIE